MKPCGEGGAKPELRMDDVQRQWPFTTLIKGRGRNIFHNLIQIEVMSRDISITRPPAWLYPPASEGKCRKIETLPSVTRGHRSARAPRRHQWLRHNRTPPSLRAPWNTVDGGGSPTTQSEFLAPAHQGPPMTTAGMLQSRQKRQTSSQPGR